MSYSFAKHLHNYACWTAARAVQRNFTTTNKIIKAIESSDLIRVEELQIETADEYALKLCHTPQPPVSALVLRPWGERS